MGQKSKMLRKKHKGGERVRERGSKEKEREREKKR